MRQPDRQARLVIRFAAAAVLTDKGPLASPAARSRAQTIARAWKTYRRALEASWPESGGRHIAAVITDLRGALDLYEALLNKDIRPASEWPELAGDPKAPATALEWAARDAADWEAELVRVFPACAGETAGQMRCGSAQGFGHPVIVDSHATDH